MTSEARDQNTSMNETLSKLSESLGQHAAMVLTNLHLPTFGGLPNEDVHKFLKEFKASTITLNDELRCLALDKALIGCAHTWAKKHIKTDIKVGNWIEAKHKLRERFVPPDENLRHLEKLSKMKYNPTEITLSCYIEGFATTYVKAHEGAADKDVIRALRVNLPHEVIHNLNILSENWADLNSVEEFMKIIQRIERSIIPFEKKQNAVNPEYVKLSAAIEDLSKKLTAQPVKTEKPEQVEVLAAVSRPADNRNQPNRGQKRTYHGEQQQSNQGYSKRYNGGYRANNNTQYNQQGSKTKTQLQEEYERSHGKPPGPCYTCQELHFHRHCPYRALN